MLYYVYCVSIKCLCSNTNNKQVCQFQGIIRNDAILQSGNNSHSGVPSSSEPKPCSTPSPLESSYLMAGAWSASGPTSSDRMAQELQAHLCSNTNNKQVCQFQGIIRNDAILQHIRILDNSATLQARNQNHVQHHRRWNRPT
jgi:hypothetical protein